RPVVRHRMNVSSPAGVPTFFTSTSGRTWNHPSLSSNSASKCFIWLRGVPTKILALPLADRRQVRLTHDAAIEDPDPPRLAVLPFHDPHHDFQRAHIRAIALEHFIAEWESFHVHD